MSTIFKNLLLGGIIIRDKIINELIKEIQGPRGTNFGEESDKGLLKDIVNETMHADPLSEYMTGVLIPKSVKATISEDDNLDPDSETTSENKGFGAEDDDTDEEEFEISVPSELDPRLRSKSFGISFFIQSKHPTFKTCITWGRYFENIVETEEENENEKNKPSWTRVPYHDEIRTFDVINDDFSKPITIFKDEKIGGKIELYVKTTKQKEEDTYLVHLSLINDLYHNKENKIVKAPSCIFQPSIRINLGENSEIPNMEQKNEEEDVLHFIYRKRHIKAFGHMCSVVWREIDYMNKLALETLWPDGLYFSKTENSYEKFIRPDIRTEFVPLYPMPISSFDIKNSNNEILEFPAQKLSEAWDNEQMDNILKPLIDSYSSWIQEQIKEKDDPSNNYPELTDEIISKQIYAINRMNKGLNLIKEDEKTKLAFCFANKAIDKQSKWARGEEHIFNWRPFQIAFFLMNIESIVKEDSVDRNTLDLLWISTGGGKTEAYLGIMAFTAAYRRLNGLEVGETGAGVSILSRYTLRLLTVQQFRRTLNLVTAAEYLRVFKNEDNTHGWRPKDYNNSNDYLYGSTRFSVGMWVGKAVSPLHMRGGEGAIANLENIGTKEEIQGAGDPAQVVKCPVCGNWLAIPDKGLPKDEKEVTLHFIIKIKEYLIKGLIEEINEKDFVEKVTYTPDNLKNETYTLSIKFEHNEIPKAQLKEIYALILNNQGDICSLNFYRPGYFGTTLTPNGKVNDYEIYCTNPECHLNEIEWSEGVPIDDLSNKKLPDGNFERIIPNIPFTDKRMPIPAYTVDEQVYFKCPTIVISTADKIARLAFEPRAAGLFGNVERYNSYYGYYRKYTEDLKPNDSSKRRFENENIDIKLQKPLKAPDLIIQDELHLIDGPLGSLFGLYESVISAILAEKDANPKYIASTATINNSEDQSKLIFSKKLFQFPPHGLSIDDNFFVQEHIESSEIEFKDSIWNENNSGRIYMGVYCPGKGPITPQIRLWSSIFDTCQKNIDDENILYYWTLVGYYNSMRELGGGGALYREDIGERLNHLHSKRVLNKNLVELSSRMPSTEIPLKLSEIEMDGDRETYETPDNDAILTTSMFGTGVDVPHLSLMVVSGQPKTTGSYIQATGRIGRKHGGLVVTFLKAGRPRDLKHYETFPSYHYRLHLGIEPVSVSPFSFGSLDKASGASLVSFLRNSLDTEVNWTEKENGININLKNAKNDIDKFIMHFRNRLNYIYDEDNDTIERIINQLQNKIYLWITESKHLNELSFQEYSFKMFGRNLSKNVVLGDPAHEHNDELKVIFKNSPQSLREIEETTGFWV